MVKQTRIRRSLLTASLLLAATLSAGTPAVWAKDAPAASPVSHTLSDVPAKDPAGPVMSYVHYRDVLLKKDCKMDQILPLLAEETTKNAPPVSEQGKFLEIIQLMAPPQVTVTKETITGNKAELLVKAPSPKIDSMSGSNEMKTTGVISMSHEKGQWKIIKESWNSTNIVSDQAIDKGNANAKPVETAPQQASDTPVVKATESKAATEGTKTSSSKTIKAKSKDAKPSDTKSADGKDDNDDSSDKDPD